VRLSIVSMFMLLVIVPQPSWAGQVASKAQTPEMITILGKTFRVLPFELEDTPRSWAEVRSYVPPVLLQKPKQPLTKKQILTKINALLHARGKQYDSDLDALTDRHLKAFLKTTPQANWDWFNLALAGDCLANKPGPFLPESTVRLCQEYTALLYLQEMLGEASAQSAANPAATMQAVKAPAPAGPSLKPLSKFKDCDHCPEMVVIPPGSYLMGGLSALRAYSCGSMSGILASNPKSPLSQVWKSANSSLGDSAGCASPSPLPCVTSSKIDKG